MEFQTCSVESVYEAWDEQKLLLQCNLSIVVTLGTTKSGCYREMTWQAQVKIHAIDSIWTLPSVCYKEVTCDHVIHYRGDL